MQKIFLFMMVSVDGYFEGENHNIDWHNVDGEFNEYAIAQTDKVGTFLFGRRTYELMASYWQTESARKGDPIVAQQMNETPKIVFSKSMERLTDIPYWKNVTLVHEIDVEQIKKLKEMSNKDIGIYGSNNLCVNLIQLGLVDELRIMVNPVALGKGSQLLTGLNKQIKLELTDTKIFKSGNVLLFYKVK